MSRIKNDLLGVVQDRNKIEYTVLNRPIQDKDGKLYALCYPLSEEIINQIIMDDISILGGLRILPGVTPVKIWVRDLILVAPYLNAIKKNNIMMISDYFLSSKSIDYLVKNHHKARSTIYSILSRYSEYILFKWKENMIYEYCDNY